MIILLDLAALAERVGLSYATVRSMRSRGTLPEPDAMLGQSAGWLPETVDAWSASRRGPGRPRKP